MRSNDYNKDIKAKKFLSLFIARVGEVWAEILPSGQKS